MRAIGLALGGPLPESLTGSVTAALRVRGWSTERTEDRSAWLDAAVVLVGDRERWFVLLGNTEPPTSLAEAVAKALGTDVRCHRLEVRDEAHPESEEGYWYECHSFTVSPDGQRASAASGLDELEPSEANFGDLGETANRLLYIAIQGDVADERRLAGMTFYRVGSALPARLADLVRQIRDAGGWTVQDMGERRQARVVLADGSRRISVLTPQEVDAVAEETGISPGGVA